MKSTRLEISGFHESEKISCVWVFLFCNGLVVISRDMASRIEGNRMNWCHSIYRV